VRAPSPASARLTHHRAPLLILRPSPPSADLTRQSREREASLGRLEAARAALQSARAQEEVLREARAASERETASISSQARSLEESVALFASVSAAAGLELESARAEADAAAAKAKAARARQIALQDARDVSMAECTAVRGEGKRALAEAAEAFASASALEGQVREARAALLTARAEARAAREAAQTAAARQSMLKAQLAAARASIVAAEAEVVADDRRSAEAVQASLRGTAATAVPPQSKEKARAPGGKGPARVAGVKRAWNDVEGDPSPTGRPAPPLPQPHTLPRAPAPASSSRAMGVKLPTFSAIPQPVFGLSAPTKALQASADDPFATVALVPLGRTHSGHASAGTSDPVGDDWTRMFED